MIHDISTNIFFDHKSQNTESEKEISKLNLSKKLTNTLHIFELNELEENMSRRISMQITANIFNYKSRAREKFRNNFMTKFTI